MHFSKTTLIASPAAIVFGFHERPDAFERLQPPWQKFEILEPPTSLAIGTRVVLRVAVGPFWQTIEAEHIAYEPGRMFADRMIRGPFRSWLHRHIVTPVDDDSCILSDEIDYELPFGALGRSLGGGIVRRQLERLFDYRHEVTREACAALMDAS